MRLIRLFKTLVTALFVSAFDRKVRCEQIKNGVYHGYFFLYIVFLFFLYEFVVGGGNRERERERSTGGSRA